MLQNLYIQNYALIDTLHIEFHNGFSVITGETGAGKSIILGAIGLLLGQRADTKSIKNGEPRCIIEAKFDLSNYEMEPFFKENDLDFDEKECIVRREIIASGKSRAFINDTPVQVTLLKELGERLIDVHSQHQNLLLNKEDFQLNVIDTIAQNKEVLAHYVQCYAEYKKLCTELDTAREEARKNKAEEDYLRFQLELLEDAQLRLGEQEELEQESKTLSHAEEIMQTLYHSESLLSDDEKGILYKLKESLHSLSGLQSIFPIAGELANRMESCYIELKDIASELSMEAERIEFNPDRLSYLNERLNVLYSLQKKYHTNNTEELIALEQDYKNKLEKIDSSDEYIVGMEQKKVHLLEILLKEASVLSDTRKKAAKEIEYHMKDKLIPLGIPNVQFRVEIGARETPDVTGIDKVCFLFSANKNGALQQIAQVASGGEIARVMLSLKAMISGAVKLPTIIFDEIDTGVSGNIAEKMAVIMQEMGQNNRQVISITHLPQIAALGSKHYKVYKQDNDKNTTSHIILLTDKQRIEEIAQMLSGSNLTDAAINNAKELLKLN